MLFSLSLILFCGFTLGGIMQKLKLPPLLGMMITGIVLGPHIINAIDSSILNISSELRQIALIVILIRAGLSMDLQTLKKVGRPAVLMCFIPATFELAAIVVLGPLLLNITYLEAAILGSVLAAISPAVVVPRMIKLSELGYGKKQGIPQLIMAGASVDDVYVIILFTSFISIYQGEGFEVISLAKIPIAIISGLILGIVVGIILVWIFKRIHMRDTVKILLLLGISFLFVTLEDFLQPIFPVSGLLAVMALGAAILRTYPLLAKRISGKYAKIWVAAELMLFVLVGAAVDISYISRTGIMALFLILLALIIRTIGVCVCLFGTPLTKKERIFTAIAYLPKATVQAAIGSIPLSLGLPCGSLILAVSVLAIIVTAPLGAIGIDNTYKKLLSQV